ncbi:transcriptional regulator [Methylomonas sp. LL1]|uniref:Rho-binding antiterminator n=1 Tax=Methylomonas sp. LL1 TaxID=2785785 RepID=UPI0018C39435|nr:Rho-binding antiterminator [Methylomonas sp. LL1]QPK65277.1 transcriptional regulator [Methylomonas sp. LL1]
MYGYRVKLTLTDLKPWKARRSIPSLPPKNAEYLFIDHQQIELNWIKKLQVLTPNAKFSEVVF